VIAVKNKNRKNRKGIVVLIMGVAIAHVIEAVTKVISKEGKD